MNQIWGLKSEDRTALVGEHLILLFPGIKSLSV